MNPIQAAAFIDELEKQGAPAILNRLWGSGIGRSLVGAGAGAGVGALTDEDAARGAIRGGLLGGALGLSSPLVTSAGRKRAGEGFKRFYQAQKHGLTGRGRMPAPKSKGRGPLSSDQIRHHQAEKAGLGEISLLPPLKTSREVYKDFATQVIAKY